MRILIVFALLLVVLFLVVGIANGSIDDDEAKGESVWMKERMILMIFFFFLR